MEWIGRFFDESRQFNARSRKRFSDLINCMDVGVKEALQQKATVLAMTLY
jgi:hypothetical protein